MDRLAQEMGACPGWGWAFPARRSEPVLQQDRDRECEQADERQRAAAPGPGEHAAVRVWVQEVDLRGRPAELLRRDLVFSHALLRIISPRQVRKGANLTSLSSRAGGPTGSTMRPVISVRRL